MNELVEVMEVATLPWQDRCCRGLTSDDVRTRLHTYSTLSAKCSESKETQKQVGQLFGGPRSGTVSRFAGSSMLNVLFDDLRSSDRTLRIAATRVLCLMAYENLTNQQLIIRSQAGGDEEMVGVTVGWVHAFFIPQSLRDRYEAQCEERGLFTTPIGLNEFVSNIIKDNYASAFTRIGRYYAGGCREFLPLCWFQALVNDSSEATDMLDVPDPNENLVGFYLVPRQMQFPEQDNYFLQEILSSIRTEAELSRLQRVHAAFQQVAFRSPAKEANAGALRTALEGVLKRVSTTLDSKEETFILNQQHANLLHWLDASPERTVTWNELLVWCCTDMNADEMLKRFGADACRTVGEAFQRLTLGSEGLQRQKDQVKTFVWEPTLVGTLLNHPDLPEELKANIRSLSSTYASRLELPRRKTENITSSQSKTTSGLDDEALDRPWEYLLRLELAEIHPISWGVFLSKWRQGADTKSDGDDVQSYHQSERRHHSVHEGANSSVLIARKNALVTNHRIFNSFRDLNQLRQQLPLITNRPSEIREETFEDLSTVDRLLNAKIRLSDAEERELEENRKLFRRLQESSANLDEVTRQQLEERRFARCKAHERAAENREKTAQLIVQRQQELERTKRDRQAKVQERVHRRERRWQILIEARQERHERAQWWKLNRLEAEITRQEEFMQGLQRQRTAERMFEQNQHAMVQTQQPPSTPPTRERPSSCPRRPLSARTATDPHIARGRANVYGCAATKAFTARRPQTARPDFYSGTREMKSPRARQQSVGFRRSRSAIDRSSGDGQNEVSNASSLTDSSGNDRQAGVGNACETLVMTNAAHAVAQQIAIPPVAAPAREDEAVAPGVIMAQFLALEKEQKFKLRERYCVNRVSHKLTFAVLQQLTHEVRQDAAWREFLRAAGGPVGTNSNKRNKSKSKRDAKVTYTAFASVAHQLGISMPPKKLQAVARSLDPWKTGFVSWESFYTWWSSQ
ncbi:hypothetical protein PF008_g7200 [Phytophthora fragariae]|uniref:EF-hand domain-containing protein n=1 Tax=Phytophthora fragariae TaxID=53985 RepID=A0A6G0S3T6_9STRA|nr:hypothetical protein PF008_g7200 [Phytophthora fragariae]